MDKNISPDYELLRQLTQTFGPSGSEEQVSALIASQIRPFCDEIRTDALGNLMAIKHGKGPKIMIAAHMDEIGVMVTYIDEKGFLRFTTLGGIHIKELSYRRVQFADGRIGTIGMEKMDKPNELKLENLFIDIGAGSAAEAEQMVSIGSSAVFVGDYYQSGSYITSKALDDRVGCFAAIEALKQLKSEQEFYFVFTAQEEVGLRGSKTAAYALNPDLALSVDVTSTGDVPKGKTPDIKLGKGTAIKVLDRSMITPPHIKEWMGGTAEKHQIPYQWEVLEAGGNDGGAILLSRGGIPTGVVSIPTRYVHSPSEKVSTHDIEASIALLTHLLQNPIQL